MKFFSHAEKVDTVQSNDDETIINSQVVSQETTNSLLSCLNIPVRFFSSASAELKDSIIQEKLEVTPAPLYMVYSDNEPIGVTPHWKYEGNHSDRLNAHMHGEELYTPDDLTFLTYSFGITPTCMGKWDQQIMIRPNPYGAGKISIYVRWKHQGTDAALSRKLITLTDSPTSSQEFYSLIYRTSFVFKGFNTRLEAARLLGTPFLSLMQTKWYHTLPSGVATSVRRFISDFRETAGGGMDWAYFDNVAYQALAASSAAVSRFFTPVQRVALEVMCYDLLMNPSEGA
jgi:hypothetical protein